MKAYVMTKECRKISQNSRIATLAFKYKYPLCPRESHFATQTYALNIRATSVAFCLSVT